MARVLVRLLPAVLSCCSLLFNTQLSAQEAKAASAAGGNSAAPATAKFTTHTQLVLIPVVVTGKNGVHVDGLTRDAFHIEERGKPRRAAIFEEIKSVAPDVKTRAAAQAEGHTNFSFAESGSWRVTVVVMDLVNTPFLSQQEGKRELMAYLQKNLRREEPTTLLGLKQSGLKLLHPFTSDTGVLVAALKKLQGEFGTTEMNDESASLVADMTDSLDNNSVSQSASMISQFMQDAEATRQAYEQRNATRATLEAMLQIAHAYEAIPGRKTLIWASGGFPFMIDDPQAFARMGTDMVAQYEETWRALSAAGVAVYPVDLTGLHGFSGATAGMDASKRGSTGRRSGAGWMSVPGSMTVPYDKDQQRQMSLRAFADATGGLACVNSNDMERCFSKAEADSRSYYMLGYYLPSDDQQPGWRKLKVKVDAEDVHVRAREGFYVGAIKEDTPQSRQQEIVEALRSPIEFTGVRMNVRELPTSAEQPLAASGKTTHRFSVIMPAKSVTVDVQSNAVDMTIIAVAVDAKGRNAGQGEKHVAGNLKPESAERIRRGGIAAELAVELPPGKYEMRFAARDNLNGERGTVVFPLEVK